MAYRLYSRFPSQHRFYATNHRTLQQAAQSKHAPVIFDREEAREILATVQSQCLVPGVLFEIKEV